MIKPITVSLLPMLDDEVSFRMPVEMFDRIHFFYVDTGTSVTSLEAKFRPRLGEPLRQWGDHELFRSPEIRVGKRSLGLSEVFCADFGALRLITGEPCDGILGMDFLMHHVMRLDFDEAAIVIGGSVPPLFETAAWKIPMTPFNQGHFTIPAVFNGAVILDVLVDSADSGFVSLSKADWDRIFPTNGASDQYTTLLAGINRQLTESRVKRLPVLQIGGHSYFNVICALRPFPNAQSAIGLGFLRRHLVIFDFPNHALYLRPGEKFHVSDEHDMSGLHLLRRESTTFVHSVDEGSPAMSAGVRAGDQLVSLDGTNCAFMGMKEIRAALRTKPGAKVVLKIQREEKAMTVEFALKRFL